MLSTLIASQGRIAQKLEQAPPTVSAQHALHRRTLVVSTGARATPGLGAAEATEPPRFPLPAAKQCARE